jgi:hypothetical protein
LLPNRNQFILLVVYHIAFAKGCWLVANVHASFHENPSVYLKIIRKLRRQRNKTVYQFLGLTMLFGK